MFVRALGSIQSSSRKSVLLVAGVRRISTSSQRRSVQSTVAPSKWRSEKDGQNHIFFFPATGAQRISPWHDIPLKVAGTTDVFHYVNEIPKGSRAKMEIATKLELNPIKQDLTKQGDLRFFKYGDIPFNYGALPQTWENPHDLNAEVQAYGDNDPVDVVELSPEPLPMGSVSSVRVLGALALIDENELDWKLLAIDINHALAKHLNDHNDLMRLHGDKVAAVIEWFKNYKTAEGKGVNTIGFNEQLLNKDKALSVIEETHHFWKDLVTGKIPKGKLTLPSSQ